MDEAPESGVVIAHELLYRVSFRPSSCPHRGRERRSSRRTWMEELRWPSGRSGRQTQTGRRRPRQRYRGVQQGMSRPSECSSRRRRDAVDDELQVWRRSLCGQVCCVLRGEVTAAVQGDAGCCLASSRRHSAAVPRATGTSLIPDRREPQQPQPAVACRLWLASCGSPAVAFHLWLGHFVAGHLGWSRAGDSPPLVDPSFCSACRQPLCRRQARQSRENSCAVAAIFPRPADLLRLLRPARPDCPSLCRYPLEPTCPSLRPWNGAFSPPRPVSASRMDRLNRMLQGAGSLGGLGGTAPGMVSIARLGAGEHGRGAVSGGGNVR